MRVVRLVRSRTQPHVVIQFSRNWFWSQVLFSYPEELPSKTGSTGDSHLQRPTQQAAIHQLLQWFDGSTQSIEIVLETEPGIQSEDTVVLLHGFHYPLAFANGTGHWLFTPDVLTSLGSFYRHQGMPMRRSGNVNYIHIRVFNQVTEIMISLQGLVELLLAQVHRLLQMVLVYITYRYQTARFITGKVIATSTDTTYPNDTLGQLVARCDVIGTSQYLSWYDGEQTNSTHCLQKVSSIGSHSMMILIRFLLL